MKTSKKLRKRIIDQAIKDLVKEDAKKLFNLDRGSVRAQNDKEFLDKKESFLKSVDLQLSSSRIFITELKDKRLRERIEADKVLIAVGRKPNTEGLNLEKMSIKVDDQGKIQVDNWLHFQIFL